MSEITEKLKVLGEKWANLPNNSKEASEIADEVMEELPQLLSKVEELEKACAFYRDSLKCIRDFDDDSPWEDPGACAVDALQRCDCGSDYIHRDEVKPLVDVLRLSLENLPYISSSGYYHEIRLQVEQALAHVENLMKGEKE